MAAKKLLPYLLILALNFCGLHAQILPNISLGSSITAGTNDSWRSLSGEFAFGFYPLQNNLYLMGIWFDKIPERTLVWSANRDTPAEAGSTIRLTFAGQLFLTYSNGSVQSVYGGAAASLGFMENNGNFVLKDGNSRVIWQSFDSPTDTLLPTQVLTNGQMLFSNAKGTTDYSTGNFMLEMQYDGNLVLSAYHFSDPGYWFTGTLVSNDSLVFDSNASLYIVNSTNDVIYSLTENFSAPTGEYYHRATIDDMGNFQQYVYHKSNGSGWISVWKAIHEPCLVNAVCGVNGMCSSPDNETVTCNCIPGYIPLDPNHVSKGCHPETVVNYCADPSMRNFTIAVIDDADFPFEGFADLDRVLNVDVEGCKVALMDDCYSIAASLVDSRCNKKRMPLLNARKSASTKGITAFVKVPLKSSNPGTQEAIYYHPGTRKFVRRKHSSNTTIGVNFREFKYVELHEATNGFSKTVGRGSSGKVYSGVLSLKNVRIEIAVKKLEKEIEKSEEEFMTELKIIGRTYHKNLVRLLGYCVENNQRLLVYELMANGTLSDLLFEEGERPSWVPRAEMVLGISRGLLYLHEECETQIIHCDVKPQNVLLDANYSAKIADFGLSKLLNKEQTRTDTNVRGTMGYLAPEWLRNAPVTSKVDVYSFGVVLLEILCCRRHIELNRVEEESEEDDLVLSDWVVSCMMKGKLEMVVRHDPEVLSDFKRFERMAMVGIWCIHPDPVLRPSMKKVTQMLEGTSEVGIPPLVHDQMS
ncbi:G-type lectin S-receptor-like serine/threonine-protein kinase LECRK3 isoform X2 [Hevea brasiliensis]|uniref:G-type lectin S-receptor-like serine/threonine-protein kinase LECRK3 isoform X2 n=1 Tax=Hevea brasiliensis TaxID=3981 RepID=UPI0025FE474B|nr:G-type lectin S-receptor-like serine/threonine-protein kinase LECRK3 isoform X2 [Hevea brasiliensis]